MNPSYSIDEPELHLAGPVAQALWRRNLNGYDEASARAKFDKGYAANPAGQGCLFMLRADGLPQACGTAALHPRAFWHGARALRAVGLADFVVDAEHRSLVPALRLARHCLQAATSRFDMAYATPNTKAAAVVMRAGLQYLGDMSRHAKPVATLEPLADRMPRLLARLVSPPLDLLLSLANTVRRWRAPPALACHPAAFDDAVFDSLWAARPADTVLSERSSRMLQWRFTGRARGDAQACIARSADGQARGYVVWRARHGFFEVLDFLCADPGRDTAALMLAFTHMARRLGCKSVSVEFFGAPAVAEQLRRAGFVRRPETLPVYAAAPAEPALIDPAQWHFTRFDDDTD
jgi:hypothetical protein